MSNGILIAGTSSDSGKSTIVAGLCRWLASKGYKVAPFKGQNMSLNSFVTHENLEIGRAQASQAMAARILPSVEMNPILLKPTGERLSQLIVRGVATRQVDAVEFQAIKAELLPTVLASFESLSKEVDFVILEGAGSPAEINLMDNDLVNLGLACLLEVPALLVGDIERGGVFAHLYGTYELLPSERRSLVKGFMINKFRGDARLLDDAILKLSRLTSMDFLGTIAFERGLVLDREDSMSLGSLFDQTSRSASVLDVAVIGVGHISNFTDFEPLVGESGLSLRLVKSPAELSVPDLLILPGSKSTVTDLAWLRQLGFEPAIWNAYRNGSIILGICGGYQMLGSKIVDDVESHNGETLGLGLLECETQFFPSKITRQRIGKLGPWCLGAPQVIGYEIHHGITTPEDNLEPFCLLESMGIEEERSPVSKSLSEPTSQPTTSRPFEREGAISPNRRVFGSNLHGIFENDDFRKAFLYHVAMQREKPFVPSDLSYSDMRNAYFDSIAQLLDRSLDMNRILELLVGPVTTES